MILASLFLTTSLSLGLPLGLLDSICWIESGYNPKAVNASDGKTGSVGLCQIQPSTAKSLGFKGTSKQLFDPKTNIKWAGKYLKYQLERYHWDVKRAVCAYNRGFSATDGRNKYTRLVLGKWRRIKTIHRGQL